MGIQKPPTDRVSMTRQKGKHLIVFWNPWTRWCFSEEQLLPCRGVWGGGAGAAAARQACFCTVLGSPSGPQSNVRCRCHDLAKCNEENENKHGRGVPALHTTNTASWPTLPARQRALSPPSHRKGSFPKALKPTCVTWAQHSIHMTSNKDQIM